MGEFAASILSRLHPTNPYDGFDYRAHPLDLQGGGGREVMTRVFDALNPKLIVEVGTWKGGSACFWAKLMKERGIDGAVVCIDTWLGGLDHITRPKSAEWQIKKYWKHGYSTLYYQFLANVMHEGLQDYIVPVPTTSAIGARWLQAQNLVVDIAYIDASHDEDDVYEDMKGYWKTLRNGGIMCGDDWDAAWFGVICAVNRFAREKDLNLQIAPPTWVLQKTLSAESQLVLNVIGQQLQTLKQSSSR
jgi:hypothetical protein